MSRVVTDLSKNGTSQYKTFENEEGPESNNSKEAAKTFSKDGKLFFFFMFQYIIIVRGYKSIKLHFFPKRGCNFLLF